MISEIQTFDSYYAQFCFFKEENFRVVFAIINGLLTRKITRSFRWEKPTQGWLKLNTDGSSVGNPGLAGCRGAIRDDAGRWIIGFSRRIGMTSSFAAEL